MEDQVVLEVHMLVVWAKVSSVVKVVVVLVVSVLDQGEWADIQEVVETAEDVVELGVHRLGVLVLV